MMEALKERSFLIEHLDHALLLISTLKYLIVLAWPKNHSTHKPSSSKLKSSCSLSEELEYHHHEDERNNSDLKCIMF